MWSTIKKRKPNTKDALNLIILLFLKAHAVYAVKEDIQSGNIMTCILKCRWWFDELLHCMIIMKSNILPVTAVMFTPLLLTFSNTEKRVNVYSVPAVRDETVWVTGPSPSGAVISISVPLNWRIKLSVMFTVSHCRVILVSSCPVDLKLSAFGGTETKRATYKSEIHHL